MARELSKEMPSAVTGFEGQTPARRVTETELMIMRQYFVQPYGGRQFARPMTKVVKQVVVVRQQATRLPGFMERLQVVCNGDGGRKHPLPTLCRFTTPTLSQSGDIAAEYRCPLCGKRFNYVVDRQTGKPRLLWVS